MNKTLVLLLALTLVAALSVAQDKSIQAQYDEVVSYGYAQTDAYAHLLATNTSTAVTLQPASLIYGTHLLVLSASDTIGNPAVHQTQFTQENPLGMEVLEPSVNGVSDEFLYDLSVQTQREATCEWAFYAGAGTTVYEEFGGNAKTHTLAYAFSDIYRFPDGEFVPVQIRCSADGYEQVMIAHVGYASDPQLRESFSLETTAIRIDKNHPTRIDIRSQAPSTCMIEGTDDRTSVLRTNHVFDHLQDGTYAISCINAHGRTVELGDYRASYALNDDDVPAPGITLRSETVTESSDYQLVIDTTIPSTCNQTFTNTRMGRYQDGLMHQSPVILEQGENTGTITCTSDVYNETTQEEFMITSDPQIPSFTLERASICGIEGTSASEVILEFSEIDEDVEYLLLTHTENGQVMRRPAETIRQANLVGVNGQIEIRSVDALGRRSSPYTQRSIPAAQDQQECQYLEEQPIWMQAPVDAQTQADEFDLILATLYPSQCSLEFAQNTYALNTSSGKTHTLRQAQELFAEAKNIFDVHCTDPVEHETTKEFALYWKLPRPNISVSAQPMTVTDFAQPYSTIRVQADQDVRCKVDEKQYSAQLRREHNFTVVVDGPQNQTFSIACINAHSTEPVVEDITLHEAFPTELLISDRTPDATAQSSAEFIARTTRSADCVLTISNQTLPLQSEDGARHTVTQSLTEGEHAYTYTCTERSTNKTKTSQQYSVLVDTQRPVIELEGSQLTCGLESYTVYGNVSDARLETVRITFDGSTYTYESLPATIKNLDLEENQTYPLTITASDAAGNNATATDTITASTKEDGACDREAPAVTIHDFITVKGTDITVFCEDEYGCEQTFGFGQADPASSCEVTQKSFIASEDAKSLRSEKITLTESTKICWEVSDISGNTRSGEKKISVSSSGYPEACYNDLQDTTETGVDCGGNCPSCEPDAALMCSNGVQDDQETGVDCGGIYCGKCSAGETCEFFNDCQSGVCSSGLCAEPTCTDSKRNGQETGVDCGGPECSACTRGEGCSNDADCAAGLVCSYGTCKEDVGERDTTPQTQEPYVPADEGGSLIGLLLIILGAASMLGGGGWMYWAHEHEEDAGAAAKRPTTREVRGDVLEHAKEDSVPAFADSKLREEARNKKQKKRAAAREELIGAFSKEHEDAPASITDDESDTENDDVLKDLEDVANGK